MKRNGGNERGKVDSYSMLIVGKYFMTSDDYRRIILVNSKYYDLLDFVGKNEVHAIAINIKDLITNIKGNGPHIEHLEEQLKDNISRMKDIIKRFTKNN